MKREHGFSKLIPLVVAAGLLAGGMLVGPQLLSGSDPVITDDSATSESVAPRVTTTTVTLPQSDRNPFS